MKWLIASDLHGSVPWCERLLRFADAWGADRLLLLGDLLYHGPRNDLPDGYEPRGVVRLLGAWKSRVLCVRGNCEAEVDQLVLPFPVMADYALMELDGRVMYITHGHRWHSAQLPPLQPGDILLHGHTHVPLCAQAEGIAVLNPGSAAIPKGDTWHGCMTLEDGLFVWRDLADGRERLRWRAGDPPAAFIR